MKRFVGESGIQTSANAKSRLRESRNQDLGKSEVKASEKQRSRLRKSRGQDFGKTEGNYTKKNDTDFSKTDLSIYPAQPEPSDVIEGYRAEIKTNLDYDILIQQ